MIEGSTPTRTLKRNRCGARKYLHAYVRVLYMNAWIKHQVCVIAQKEANVKQFHGNHWACLKSFLFFSFSFLFLGTASTRPQAYMRPIYNAARLQKQKHITFTIRQGTGRRSRCYE